MKQSMRVRSTKFTRRLGATNRLRMGFELAQRQTEQHKFAIKTLQRSLGEAGAKIGHKSRLMRTAHEEEIDRLREQYRDATEGYLAKIEQLETTLNDLRSPSEVNGTFEWLPQWGVSVFKIQGGIQTPGVVAENLRARLVNIALRADAGRQSD